MASTVALAIWKKDYKGTLKQQIKELVPDKQKLINTIDEDYIAFFWDWNDWTGDYVWKLLEDLKNIRHSYYELTDYGRIIEDILPFDDRGEDEMFEYILSWNPEFYVLDEPVVLYKEEEKPVEEPVDDKTNLKRIIEKLGDSFPDVLSDVLGVDASDDIRDAIKQTNTTPDESDDKPDYWSITLKDLNEILVSIDMHVVFDGKLHLIDDRGCCTFETFDTPQDLMDTIEVFLAAFYLNGNFIPDDFMPEKSFSFQSYTEAKNFCHKQKFTEWENLLDKIIRGLGDTNPYVKVDVSKSVFPDVKKEEKDIQNNKETGEVQVIIDKSSLNERLGYYENSQILINGINVLTKEQHVYKDMELNINGYTYIGIYSNVPENGYADYLLIIRNKDTAYHLVDLYHALKGELLKSIQYSKNAVYLVSDNIRVQVMTDYIFNNDIRGTSIPYNSNKQNKKLSDHFSYYILHDYTVLMTFEADKLDIHSASDEDELFKMLRYNYFDTDYTIFKFKNLDKPTKSMLLMNPKKNNAFKVLWGEKNSQNVPDGVFYKRDVLLECLKEKIPDHPAWKQENFFK